MADRRVKAAGKRVKPLRQLVIMVKEPVAGRVKTRLAREIGSAAATGFYRRTLAAVVTRLSSDSRWQTQLSVAPASAIASRLLPPGVPRVAQCGGDLGDRMQAIFAATERTMASGSRLSASRASAFRAASVLPGPVVIIGTDIPEVRPHHIAAAFDALGRHDLVFGPATDGGFWLVGMRRTPRVIHAFREVRWSTAETLADCLAGLGGHQVARAATLRDADDAADLRLIGQAVGRLVLPALVTL